MKNIKAFSLIELLISLIIISLITCAFLPILTKKIKHKEVVLGVKGAVCSKFDSENRCLICDNLTCKFCATQTDVSEGYYVNPEESCEVKKCENKFQNCASCNKNKCLFCKEGYGFYDSVCSKCAFGTISKNNACINPCEKYANSLFIPTIAVDRGICVQKVNAGDPTGITIYNSMVIIKGTVSQGASGSSANTSAVCWQGKTASNCNNLTGYSGCNRTVCTWYAARKICEYHGWRLPTNYEASLFGKYSVGKGKAGLRLCDHSLGQSDVCEDGRGLCPQSADGGNCFPDGYWTGQIVDDLRQGYFALHNGGISGAGNNVTGGLYYPSNTPFSVRCVIDI